MVFAATEQAVIVAEDYIKTDLNSNTTIAKKNAKLTNEKGQIEADQITYSSDSGLVNASGGVKLTAKDGIIITAEQINYNGNTGLVNASGGVKIATGNGIYQTETIEYNLNDATGSSGPIAVTINAVDRNYSVIGDSMETADGITKITKAKITRCQMSDPEYRFVAKEATYDGQYLHLKNTLLYLKRIPLFYYPALTLDMDNMDNMNLPIESGYNQDDGFYLLYDYSTHLSENTSWRFRGVYRTEDYSSLLFGLTNSKGKASNYTGLYYNTESAGYGIEDRLTYDAPLFITTVDGLQDFSANNLTELGFSITRKYWESPIGRWQFGILGRKVYEVDGSGVEYGGTYGGYRLDYNPHLYVTLSILQLYSFAGGDYRGFMDEFKIGSNWLYNSTIPLSKSYTFGLSGTYNSDQSLWIHQIYQINYKTDCLRLSVGWDDAEKSLIYSGNINF